MQVEFRKLRISKYRCSYKPNALCATLHVQRAGGQVGVITTPTAHEHPLHPFGRHVWPMCEQQLMHQAMGDSFEKHAKDSSYCAEMGSRLFVFGEGHLLRFCQEMAEKVDAVPGTHSTSVREYHGMRQECRYSV